MAAEIERIVDRKLVKQRVHYLVVWRGFGEESNTWCVLRLPASWFSLLLPELMLTMTALQGEPSGSDGRWLRPGDQALRGRCVGSVWWFICGPH